MTTSNEERNEQGLLVSDVRTLREITADFKNAAMTLTGAGRKVLTLSKPSTDTLDKIKETIGDLYICIDIIENTID